MPRGGKRPGSGRPEGSPNKKKSKAKHVRCADSAELLAMVVRGDIEADISLRVAAARVLLPFEKPKTRAPLPAATRKPKEEARAQAKAAEDASLAAFEKKASEIRKKHGRTD